MRMNNKVLIMTVLIAGSLILSGCVNNTSNKANPTNSTSSITSQKTPLVPSPTVTQKKSTLSTESTKTETVDNSTFTMPLSSSWCQENSIKTINGREYKITGTTEFNGREVCKAVIESSNGTTVRYFSQDGSFSYENSSSSGNNASATASSSAHSSN